MKTRLEETKMIEEVLKDKLDDKEEQCQKLEMEVVGLRKTSENYNACVKFKKKSIILEEILNCQRSPFDKFGLGYNSGNENSEADTWTPRNYEAGPSFSKYEIHVAPHILAKDIKKLGGYQGVSPSPQSKFRKYTSSKWNQASRYENRFNGFSIHVVCARNCF